MVQSRLLPDLLCARDRGYPEMEIREMRYSCRMDCFWFPPLLVQIVVSLVDAVGRWL